MNKYPLPLLFLLAALLLTGCEKNELKSSPRVWEIAIDGRDTDWPDSCIHYLEKPGQSAGFANDDKYFYVLFRLADPPTIHRLMVQGATLWLKPQGKNRFGLRYPIGAAKDDRWDQETADPSGRHHLPGGKMIERAQRQMEVIIPDQGIKQLLMSVLSKSYGIEARFWLNQERFVYELKIPLEKLPPMDYSLDAGNASWIDIALESEPAKSRTGVSGSELSDFGGAAPEGRTPGGRTPGGGFAEGGGMPSGGTGQSDKLEMKFRVILAR